MPVNTPKNSRPPFNKSQLLSLRTKAMRSGAWFKALKRIDRVLIDLTIKVVGNIRSAKLTKSILTLANKLESAMKSTFMRKIEEIGSGLVQKISLIGQKLGNLSARSWVSDTSFAFFLAVLHINSGVIKR